MKDRIKKIQEYSGLSLGVFASRTGIKSASLSHILNGRNNPSLDVVMKIHETFPDISWDWILYGTGPMLNGAVSNQVENKQVVPSSMASTTQSNRTIFDNDPSTVESSELIDDNEPNDDSIVTEDTNVAEVEPTNTVDAAPSKPTETIVTPQKSEAEIIDSFLKSDLYRNMLETQVKKSEKSVKKIIVLYDDETFAEYSLNKL